MKMLLRNTQRTQPTAKTTPTTKPAQPDAALKSLVARIKSAVKKKAPLQPLRNANQRCHAHRRSFSSLYQEKCVWTTSVYDGDHRQLNKLYLFSPTLEGGTGDTLLTFAMLDEYPFLFVRHARALYMIEKNVKFRVSPKSALSKIIDRSFANSIRAANLILSDVHPKKKMFFDRRHEILQHRTCLA